MSERKDCKGVNDVRETWRYDIETRKNINEERKINKYVRKNLSVVLVELSILSDIILS